MAPQFCPECGTVVPVTDGTCHVGHPVPAEAPLADDVAPGSAVTDTDGPTPWVATVEDDIQPHGEPDPSAPPPPPTTLGSATMPPAGAPNVTPSDLDHVRSDATAQEAGVTGPAAGVEAAADDGRTGDGSAEHAPQEAAVTESTPPEPADDDSLEDLAAMAAAGSGDRAEGDDDLSHLGDDLSGDLGAGPEGTPPPPGAYDLGATSQDDDFDLDSLEEAVAELDGDLPMPPPGGELAPEAPGPDAAPTPQQAIAEFPRVPDEAGETTGPEAGAGPVPETAGEEPVAVRPDHGEGAETGEPPSAEPLDPKNFTASGRRVSTARSGGSESLLDKLKGLFGR